MKLNNLKEVDGFISTLDNCTGAVWLESPDGDRINLKSKLSQYIGLAELLKQKLDLELFCTSAHDEALFYKFFMENPHAL